MVGNHIGAMVELLNGHKLPRLGLGTWELTKESEIQRAVETAMEAGYRLFDTASVYRNEIALGRALRGSGLKREEYFVIDKLWISCQGRDLNQEALNKSLERLALSYIDLYLLHWPVAGKSLEAWEQLEKSYSQGLVKALGVSNFNKAQIDSFYQAVSIKPTLNQIESHPYRNNLDLINHCRLKGLEVCAYSPLARGKIGKNQYFEKLARRYGVSPYQIVLRWGWQHGSVMVPKSSKPERIVENASIFGFSLERREMEGLDRQNQDRSVLKPPFKFDEQGYVIE